MIRIPDWKLWKSWTGIIQKWKGKLKILTKSEIKGKLTLIMSEKGIWEKKKLKMDWQARKYLKLVLPT